MPRDNRGLAQAAKDIEPVVRQVFIGAGKGIKDTDALERKLYIIRKASGHHIQALKLADGKMFYVPSMSARTVLYKGMLLAYQVGEYYLDLQDPRDDTTGKSLQRLVDLTRMFHRLGDGGFHPAGLAGGRASARTRSCARRAF